MAFIEYAVEELSSPLKIEDSVIAYAEAQMGPQRNTRLAQRLRPRPSRSSDQPRELLLQRRTVDWRSLREPQRS